LGEVLFHLSQIVVFASSFIGAEWSVGDAPDVKLVFTYKKKFPLDPGPNPFHHRYRFGGMEKELGDGSG
jgi:hypothetical protein